MGLFDKIRLNHLTNGKLKLDNLPVEYGFNEEFVEASINGGGCEEFEHASSWLRGDANFILKLVSKYPEILQYCEDVIYDRFVDESGILREKEMDKFFFAIKCCDKNLQSFRYLDEEVAKKYIQAVKESKIITGEYHGEKQEIALQNSEFVVNRLLNIRYDIIRCGDLVSSI